MRKPDDVVVIEPLPDDEGGGLLATVPDLSGCMSDGETREEAARNVEDAIASWLEGTEPSDGRSPSVAQRFGSPDPAPGSAFRRSR